MVREVDKIVANLLIAEGAVSIPGVGSLRVVRRGARRISSGKIVPPCRMVEYASQPAGTSLAAAIACAAGCDAKQAQDICGRWLAQVRTEQALTIGGVGVLRQKSFTMDAAFDKLLNPQGHEPVKLRGARSGHWLLWIVAAVAIVCGLGACGWILYDQMNFSAAKSVAERPDDRAISAGTGAETAASSADEASGENRPEGITAAGEADRSLAAAGGTVSSARSGAATGNAGPDPAPAGAGTDRSALAGTAAVAAGLKRPVAGAAAGSDLPAKPSAIAPAAEGSADLPASGAAESADRRVADRSGSGASVADASTAGVSAAGRSTSGVSSSASSDAAASARMQAARLVSGHTYVVLGVYSSLENARRALGEVERREPALRCRIYFYGPKYMVSMFSSEKPEAGAAFVRTYSDRFPDMWTYRAR